MRASSEGGTETPQLSVEEPSAVPVSAISKETKQLDACVICLEPVSERAVAVPCNHCAFDFICIITWLQGNSQCPLCKRELTAIQYDWRAPDDYKEYHVTQEPPLQDIQRRRDNVRQRASRYRPYHSSSSSAADENAARLSHDLAISRRRYVYRHKLYSLHVGSNRVSCFRDFTPQAFSRSIELQSRARKWIRRELQVFDFLSPTTDFADIAPRNAQSDGIIEHNNNRRTRYTRRTDNVEFLLEYVVSILKTVDIKGSSGHAQTMLQEFLGEANASLFLHELNAWLRSPYSSLEDWDRHVQYRLKLPGFSGLPSSPPLGSAPSLEERVDSQSNLEHFRQRGARARQRYEAD